MLARLEWAGWVESRWEDVDPRTGGRPARRYCRLSADGVLEARQALATSYQGSRRVRIATTMAEPS